MSHGTVLFYSLVYEHLHFYYTLYYTNVNIVESTYTVADENRKGHITTTAGYITNNISNEGRIEDVTRTSHVRLFSKYSVSMNL